MEGQAKEDVDDDMFSKTSSNFRVILVEWLLTHLSMELCLAFFLPV